MIVHLFCPYCAYEASLLKKAVTIDVPVPVMKIADDGRYNVVCEKNHKSIVILSNIKFELLFEMGLNAIIDGYYRESVSSFASALERFYEFYWRVVLHKYAISEQESLNAWKYMGKLSERQIGGYITASLILTGKAPSLLNSNKDVPFRNSVIHNGYMPTRQEAISFGDTVKNIIDLGLDCLRELASISLVEIYSSLSPKSKDSIPGDETNITGRINILTTLDVLHPPDIGQGDVRGGNVLHQLERIAKDREPHWMHAFPTEEELNEYLTKKGLDI